MQWSDSQTARRSGNQAAHLVLPGLQDDIRRKLIGIVLLASEDWHVQKVKRSVSGFVNDDLYNRPYKRIDRSYAGLCGLFRNRLPDPVQEFVAHRDYGIVVPGIDFSVAAPSLEQQPLRHAKRRQKVSYLFQ